MQKAPRFTLDHDTQQKFYISFFGCLSLTSKQPKILQSIFFHLSHLQYICISIWIQVHLFNTKGDHPFTYYVRRVAEIANLRELCLENFESWAYSFVWILLWIYFGAFLICWFFSAFYSRNVEINKKFNLLHIIFQLFARAHFSIFFWIINMIIMVPFLSQVQDKKLSIGLQARSTDLTIMNTTLMVLNYIIGGITALFCYHSFHGESSFAARTPSLQFLTFFSKAIITPLITSGDENRAGKEVVLVIFSVILTLVKLGVLYKEFPYYEFSTMKTIITWKSIAAWISIMNALILIFIGDVLDWDLNPIIFLDLIPLPILVKAAITIFKRIVETYQMKSPFGLVNEGMVYKKILAFRYGQRDIQLSLQSQQKHNPTDLKFLAKLSHHAKICRDSSCICDFLIKRDKIGQQSIPDLQASLERYFSERFLEILANSLPNMKKNDHVKLSLACILIDLDKGELLKGLGYLFSIPEQQSSLFVKIRRHILLRKAQAKIDQNSDKKIFGDFDMKKVMSFYIEKQQFTEKILSNCQKYIDFWSFYNTPNFDILDFLYKSENLEIEADKIEKLWNSNVTKYPEFYSISIGLYYLYLKLVRGRPFTASKIAKSFLLVKRFNSDSDKTQRGLTQENLYAHDTMILKVTMSKEKLGKVLYVSNNILPVLGFQSNELIEKNINRIMPSSFREPHNQILEKYLLHEKNKKHQYVSTNSYILNKEHYVVPCSLYVTVTPFLQNELTFLGALRISQAKTTDQIIITEDGLIDGTTEKVGRFLRIPLTKSIHLTEICYYSQTHLQSTENKKIKWLSLVDRLTNESLTPKDMLSPSASPQGRRRERFTTNIEYNARGPAKPNWCTLFMIRRHFISEDELQEEHIEYQAKLTTQTICDKKFYVMALKRSNNKIKSINVKALAKSKAIDDVLNTSGVPDEGPGSNRSVPLASPLTITTSRNLITSVSPQKMKPLSMRTTARNESSPTERGRFLFDGTPSSPDFQTHAMSTFAFNHSPRKRSVEADIVGQTRGISMVMESVEEDSEDLDKNEGDPLGLEIFDKKEKQSLKYSAKASSTTSAGNELPKLEEAVYSVPQNKFERYSKIVGIFSSAVCLALLYLYVHNLQDNFTSIKGTTDMLNIASFRLNRLLEFKRGTSLMVLYRNGIIDNNRFAMYSVPFMINAIYVVGAEQKDLLSANTQLRQYINGTQTKLQQEFFDNLVPMKLSNDNDDLMYLNTFDAANELITRMAHVATLYPYAFTTNNSDVDFIYNNILDEMLLSSEDIYSILVTDNNQNITKTRNIGIALMITVLVIGFVLFWFFTLRLRASWKFRDDLLSIFLRLDENAINRNLYRVKNLVTSLTLSNIQLNDFRTQNFDTESRSRTKKELDVEAASQGLRMRLKKTSFKKHKTIVIKIIVLKVIALLMLIFPFAQILITMENKSTMIKSNINTIIDVNNSLYEIVLIYVSLYDYIWTNGDMTLRTRPINSEWESIYTKRMNTADFLSNLLIQAQQDDTMSTEDKDYVTELITGNLCEVLPPKVGQQLCTLVSTGFLTKGIQSISIYTLNILRRVKDTFDHSARTLADVKSTLSLQGLIDVEISVWQWQYEAYLEIGRVYGRWTTSSIDETGDLLTSLMIFYIFWYLLAVSYYSYKLDEFIGKKTKSWKRLCRKIPLDVTVSVKQLKIYLFRISGTAYRNLYL